jgi:hypothetical protein
VSGRAPIDFLPDDLPEGSTVRATTVIQQEYVRGSAGWYLSTAVASVFLCQDRTVTVITGGTDFYLPATTTPTQKIGRAPHRPNRLNDIVEQMRAAPALLEMSIPEQVRHFAVERSTIKRARKILRTKGVQKGS